MKLNLDDLMDKQNEMPAEETKEVETTPEVEKFGIGDVVYLQGYYEPVLIIHSLELPDEESSDIVEVVWFNVDGEMFFSAMNINCLTHKRPDVTSYSRTPM